LINNIVQQYNKNKELEEKEQENKLMKKLQRLQKQ